MWQYLLYIPQLDPISLTLTPQRKRNTCISPLPTRKYERVTRKRRKTKSFPDTSLQERATRQYLLTYTRIRVAVTHTCIRTHQMPAVQLVTACETAREMQHILLSLTFSSQVVNIQLTTLTITTLKLYFDIAIASVAESITLPDCTVGKYGARYSVHTKM